MSSINKRFFIFGFLLIFSVSTVFAGTFGKFGAPTLATEKTGYLAGETVFLSGTGFSKFEDISLSVETYSDSLQRSMELMRWNVFASNKGVFNASIPFNSLSSDNGRYVVRAVGSKSGATAETTIVNLLAAAANLDQCANGAVSDPP